MYKIAIHTIVFITHIKTGCLLQLF